MTDKRTLHTKLAQVMYEAERIPKNGVAPQAMGGFRFVQVGDAADAIRKALAEKQVSMIPTAIEIMGEAEHQTSSGKVMTTLTVRTTWTLTDGESGESIVIQSLGSGADMGDKAAPKAQSNAMKYALLMGFLLSTGDDAELSDSSDRQRPPPPGGEQGRAIRQAAGVPEPDVETEELTGEAKRSGMVRIGDGSSNKLEARQGPDGTTIGFRLETDKGAVPQVIVAGPAGEALFIATMKNPGAMRDTRVTVSGKLYNVKRPGKRSFYRLKVESWEWDDFRYPAVTDAAA